MDSENSIALEQMEKLDRALDEYEGKIGLSIFSEESPHENEVKRYLVMSREQMESLGLEDCAQAAIILGSFSFHVQRCYNREMARVKWADSKIKSIISGKENQYRGSWDSQWGQAVKENSHAKDLLRLKNYAQQRAERLTYLASSVKNISDLFVNLQRAKAMK